MAIPFFFLFKIARKLGKKIFKSFRRKRRRKAREERREERKNQRKQKKLSRREKDALKKRSQQNKADSNKHIAEFKRLLGLGGYKFNDQGDVSNDSMSIVQLIPLFLAVGVHFVKWAAPKINKALEFVNNILSKLTSLDHSWLGDVEFPDIKASSFTAKSSTSIGKEQFPDLSKVPEKDLLRFKGMTFKRLESGNFAIGARHHNIMNIRPGATFERDPWIGSTGVYNTSSSGQFVGFTDPFYSIRAAAITINNYIKNHRDKINRYGGGRLTLRSMLHIYAPTSENDTREYINTVSLLTGIDPDTEISMKNRSQFKRIIRAMAIVESQTYLDDWYLDRAFDAIWNGAPPPLQDILGEEGTTSITITNNSYSQDSYYNKQ